eukprot:949829-Prymnesium_polylepis.1
MAPECAVCVGCASACVRARNAPQSDFFAFWRSGPPGKPTPTLCDQDHEDLDDHVTVVIRDCDAHRPAAAQHTALPYPGSNLKDAAYGRPCRLV